MMFLPTLLTLLTLAPFTHQLEWEAITPSGTLPPKRRDLGMGYYDNLKQIVIFGGRGPKDDTWIYDITSAKWTDVSKTTRPEPRFSFVSGMEGKYFYIAVGEKSSGIFYNDVWQFDFDTQEWTKLSKDKYDVEPETRYGAAGGVYDKKLYVSLGFSTERYGDTFYFDLVKHLWVKVGSTIGSYSDIGPHPRCLHSGAMTGDKLVIFGGCLSGGYTGGPCPSGDSWSLDTGKEGWTQLPSCATPRMYSTMGTLPVASGKKPGLILYGGSESTKQVLQGSNSPANEVGFYDPETMEWSLAEIKSTTVPSKRAGAAMTSAPDGIYMFGGSDDLWLLKGDTEDARKMANTKNCNRPFFNFLTLHGIFMFLAFGLILQAGAFVARYFRPIRPPFWFQFHRIAQTIGVLVSIGGLVCAFMSVMFGHMQFAHAVIGIIIFVLAVQQPVNGFFRPHNEPDKEKTRVRFWWEIFHKNCGRLALILAVINITLGLLLAVAHQGLKIAWYLYLTALILAYVVMEGLRFWKAKTSGDT